MNSDLDYFSKEYLPTSFGLINTGTVCYFNSLIQSLMSCSSLNKYLIRGYGAKNAINGEYLKLYERVSTNPGSVSCDSAMEIWKELQKHIMATKEDRSSKIFASGGQQCAHEALKLLLEAMGDDILSRFTVKYTNFIVCKCGHISSEQRDYNSFITLIGNEIAYVKNPKSVAIWQKQFQSYVLKHHGVVEDYKCEKCGDKKPKKRAHELRMLNEVIVVVLEKFSSKRIIYYPARLSFPKLGGGAMEYILVSQIDHFGGTNGGHYIARSVRISDNNKFCIAQLNDSSIGPASQGGFIPNPNSYLLFYHLVKSSTK